MKVRCTNELTPILTIYEEELFKFRTDDWKDDTQELVQNITTFPSCKNTMCNKRKKNLPVLPKTVDQINIDGIWTRTTKGDPFLLTDDNTVGRMLIFSTQKNLTHLSAADIIYGDGTFYTCPSLFFQLYTFHAMVDGAMYPLVHSLLPAKSELVYTRYVLKQNLYFPVDPKGGVNVTSAVQLPINLELSAFVKRWRSSVGPCVCITEGLKEEKHF
ncbi:unnamed protein product [Mytilus edulis]|uniref:Uncharacterized protein n=1 Tax=Mytilus edulis TaxID=6550 RepID=A0A8S3Q030_MYTED|nr:unnamed protein product [Mytilus edulis]